MYSSNVSENSNSIYSVFHENFADIYAAISLLKKNGVNENTISFLSKKTIEREVTSFHYQEKKSEINHNTDFSLKELLKEDNLQKIIQTEDNNKLKQIALEISNLGTMRGLAAYNSYDAISINSVVGGIKSILMSLYNIERKDMATITNSENIAFNEDGFVSKNIAIYKLSSDIKEKFLDVFLKESGVDINSPADIERAFNSEIESINEYIYNEVENEIFSLKDKGDNYLIENLFTHLDELGKEYKKPNNLEEIRISGSQRLDSVSELVKSVNQENINNSPQMYLENIKKIRTLSIKPNNNLIIRNSV